MGYTSGWSYGGYERGQIEEQRKKEQEQKKRDIEDIDGEILWGYYQMRIIEQYLEEALERENNLSEKDQKRIDKSLVVTRTGLKMLKKVVKSRSLNIDTRAWKDVDVSLMND